MSLPLQARQQITPDASEANSSKVHLPAIPTKRAAQREAERVAQRLLEQQRAADAASTVILYRTAWCGYCKRAAAYMVQQKVPFIERDIEKNEADLADYRKLGGKGSVPLIQFGNQTMMGFAQETFDQFYAEFEKSKASKVLP